MDTLSGLDATFLYAETAQTPMHVGSFCLYEIPPGFTGSLHLKIQKHIAQRLHLAPVFTRQLALIPLELGHPVWIQQQPDLTFHIRRVKGKTLTVKQAEAECAKLHGILMDRSHPLWELHVFEKIRRDDGSLCAGVYSKIHHAALDGKGGTVLTQAIMDVTAEPREVPARIDTGSGTHPVTPSKREMLGGVLSSSWEQYRTLFKALPLAAQTLSKAVLKKSAASSQDVATRKPLLNLAPLTPFNVAVTSQRSFATARLPFEPCRAMAKASKASFNDIVLWICATALRSYLAQHGGIPKKSMLAAMPISLREEGNQELNTQASMTVVELGTQHRDPLKRLQTIMASTAKVKAARSEFRDLIPTDYPSLLAPWIVGGLTKAAFKAYRSVSGRLPMPSNLVISNVPGPRVPLYMAGARMLSFHPMSIVTHGQALNITIQTYADHVDFGLIADQQAVPELQTLSDALVTAFEQGLQLLTTQNVAPSPELKSPGSKVRASKSAVQIDNSNTRAKATAPRKKSSA